METIARALHLAPETFWMVVKVLIVLLGPLSLAALLTWVERRGSALLQDRIGPNRAAILGRWRLLGFPQIVADGLKASSRRTWFLPMPTGCSSGWRRSWPSCRRPWASP